MYIEDYEKYVRDFIDKVPNLVFDVIFDNDAFVIDLNRQQLMEGKTHLNEDVRPYYSEDTYFKKPGASDRYIEWKQRITPNPKRNPDAPNLFIDGTFHKTFKLDIESDSIIIYSDDQQIARKFDNIFGLTDDNIAELWNQKVAEYIVDAFLKG